MIPRVLRQTVILHGNTFLAQSLLHHLIRYPRISRRGVDTAWMPR
jgi:hypothetical protein